MTALFSTRRRAEQFAAAVDGHVRDVPPDLQPLVSVAVALRTQEQDSPAVLRADFAADLRARLMAEAEHSLVPGAPLVLPVRERGPRERRMAVAASVAVLLGGSAGMAAAAQSALPGEALYPIKRGIEQAEAGLSVSTAGRGQDLLHQADGRLAEVEGLLAGSPTAVPQVPGTLEDFINQAQQGADLLLASYEDTQDPQAVVAVREFTARSIDVLQQLARTAPPEAQDELAAAALTLSEIDQRAVDLCDSCGDDLPGLEVPGVFLASAEVERAFAVVEGRFLDNSHPIVVDKRMVKRAQDPVETLTGATGDDGPAPTPGSEPTPKDDGGSLIELPPTDTDVTNGDKTLSKTTDDTVGDLSDGLTGVVETLLPDPELGQ
jgi:hypothetical protein